MDTTIVVLRLLHVGAGVFWAGSILFVAFMLEPAIRAAGPEGGKVMRELQARRISIVMPISALIAIITGLDLIRRIFPGGPAAWVATPMGMTFVIGGSAAIITLILGITVSLPTMKRMNALAAQMSSTGSLPDPAVAAQVVQMRGRLSMLFKLNAALVVVTVVSMAVARYMA